MLSQSRALASDSQTPGAVLVDPRGLLTLAFYFLLASITLGCCSLHVVASPDLPSTLGINRHIEPLPATDSSTGLHDRHQQHSRLTRTAR